MPVIPADGERPLHPSEPNRNDPVYYLLNTLDLTPLFDHLYCNLAFPLIELGPLLVEYRRFLVLKYTQRDTSESAPMVWCPPVLRTVWQAHVLNTRSYRAMCEAIGEWIDHAHVSVGEEHSHSARRRMDATLACYKNHFDSDPPATVWSQAARPISTRSATWAADEDGSLSDIVAGMRVSGAAAAAPPALLEPIPSIQTLAQPDSAAVTREVPNSIRLFVSPITSYTNAATGYTLRSKANVGATLVFLVRPRTSISKLFKAIAERIEGADEGEIVCVKTGVVGPLHAWKSALVLQGERLIRANEPEWVGAAVGQVGFVNEEHVLVLCVAHEVQVVER